MAATKSLPGFESPAAGFDEPFEMLDACHDRLRRSLELLERLHRYLLTHAVDEQARQAALDVLRYFTVAAPLHHEDEERHVVPLLRRSGQKPLVDASKQLMQDHAQIRLEWRTLEPLLREVVRGEPPQPHRLAEAVRKFARMNECHLVFERDVVFPQARRFQESDGPAALAAMGQEMAQRRRAGPSRG
jgi:hemerythrin-like domain-containing protein